MHFKIWQSKLHTLWRQRNKYVLLSSVLGMVTLIQTITIATLAHHWHTLVVPAQVSQPFWVNQSTVSEEYVAQMTEYFATLVLDVSPENAAFQRKALLRYVDTASYGALSNQLIALEDKLKNQSMATSFYPVKIDVECNTLTALMTGDLKVFVGEELISTARHSYLVKYSYHHGRLLLQQFSEVKKNAS